MDLELTRIGGRTAMFLPEHIVAALHHMPEASVQVHIGHRLGPGSRAVRAPHREAKAQGPSSIDPSAPAIGPNAAKAPSRRKQAAHPRPARPAPAPRPQARRAKAPGSGRPDAPTRRAKAPAPPAPRAPVTRAKAAPPSAPRASSGRTKAAAPSARRAPTRPTKTPGPAARTPAGGRNTRAPVLSAPSQKPARAKARPTGRPAEVTFLSRPAPTARIEGASRRKVVRRGK